jgi:hypothetical protein
MSAPGDFAKSVRSHAIGAAMLTVAFLTAAAPSAHAQSQSSPVRLEIGYGYGSLDRFNIVGRTQFFQSRLQVQL